MAAKKSKKTARRGRGEGTVYLRKDGRWAGSINVESSDGKRKRKYLYGESKQEAQDKVNTALYEQKQGMLVTGPQLTVKKYMEYWLEEIHKPTLRLGSYIRYRTRVNKHILPTLGHLQLQKLTADHIRMLYAQKTREGLAPATIRTIHSVLHKALEDALRADYVHRNVCDLVSPPRLTRRESHALTHDQAQKLLNTAKGHRIEVLLAVALATGMREGELLSLRWSDIDFANSSLSIQRTVSFYPKHGFVENEPKTAQGRRRVVLPQIIVEMLKQHQIRQDERRKELGKRWHEHSLVFPNTIGKFQSVQHLTTLFDKLIKNAGLPDMHFHDLRHSAATILLSMGIHPKVVQELLGHSTISMTMDTYSHVIPSMQQDAMNKWDILFKDNKEVKDTEDNKK